MLEINVCGDLDRTQPDYCLEKLFARLERFALDPMFERYGNFVIDKDPVLRPGVKRFWGNFAAFSFCFNIDTDNPELIERLTAAIRANQASELYQNFKLGSELRAKHRRARR